MYVCMYELTLNPPGAWARDGGILPLDGAICYVCMYIYIL